MKNKSILLFFSVLIVVLFNSCKQKTITVAENSYEKKYFLTSDTTKGSINIKIDVEIPDVFMTDSVLKSIRSAIISDLFGSNYDAVPTDSLAHKFTNELIRDYKLNNEPMLEKMDSKGIYSFDNEHILEGFSLLSDKNIFSYGISRYVFMGGAHGLNTRNYLNFDLKTGKKIAESDIFVPGFEKNLIELIKTRIVEQSKEDPEIAPIINLEDTDFWVDAIKPNGNFYITDESINYVFNPYEIAPFYIGQSEVILSYNRLAELLKKGSVISYLFEKK
ncbi:MAG: RsiV family protein [Paludibacter sp.]|nr:RsiV family protein [Paludibacter sp.]